MKLTYNDFALHDIGELEITQRREFEGGEAPQRAQVQLTVKVKLFQRSYADNYALVRQARTALNAPNALLVWENEANGEKYVNQTATNTSEELPEEWGTYYQEFTLGFMYYEGLVTADQNLKLLFTPEGETAPLQFDNVMKWQESASVDRFDPKRKQRRESRGKLTVSGLILGDTTLPLATRRAGLALVLAKFRKQMNTAQGLLVFGTGDQQMFSNTVRVDDFSADVDQAICAIPFSFSAHYTLFPDEGDYATLEATIDEKDMMNGELMLSCSGKIQAADEAGARAKLAATLAMVLKSYGYDKASQQLEISTTPNLISANADGDTFTELLFNAHWRRWKATNQLATYQATDSKGDPLPFGQVRTWEDGYKANRFDILRKQRRNATVTLVATGTWAATPSLTLDQRRAQVLDMHRRMKSEVNSPDGKLTFGDFNKVVRVEDLKAIVNQAETGIDWTMTATYTLFPDEANYATVEMTAEERDPMSGELTLALGGKIAAASEAIARAKLSALITTFLANYGYDKAGQQLEISTTPNLISANADGETFTELSFTGQWRRWKASNQLATFKKSGSAVEPVPFGNVRTWDDGYKADRFDPMRSQRRNATATIAAAGTWAVDPTVTVAVRRKQLLSMQRRMKDEVNSKDGLLKFGDFEQVVRVDDFQAKINQAETGIDWTLNCHFTLYPNESNYATVEAAAEEKDGMTGETFLNITGKIQASSETVARAKLALVLATWTKQYGYDAGQQMELDTTPNLISANADGDTFTELAFAAHYRKWRAANQRATFKKTGSSNEVPFGNVRTWDDGYRADRFDVHRSQRRHATGMISATGTWSADPSLSLDDRRKQLLAMQRRMRTEINGADGTLKYGDYSQVVRVDEMTAHVNQAETGIDWSLTASFSLFPNEGGYATCEFVADMKDDVESGDQFLTFSGDILAPNGSLARAKLNSLRAATLAIYGFAAIQRVRGGSQAHAVDANGDKTAGVPEGLEAAGDGDGSFVKLNFNEEYRRRTPGSVVSSQFSISSRDDTTSGLLMTTYSGTVRATGSTPDAALAAAIARAMVLGNAKETNIDSTAFLKSSSLTIERRQLTLDNPDEFVSLQFSYEYQSQMASGRAYLEMTTQTLTDSFGPDSETVSGSVVARDFATAQAIYAGQVRAAYAGRLIRSETLSQHQVQAQSYGAFKQQQLRLEFNFTAHKDKAAGKVSAKYSISVSRDFLNLQKKSRVRGSVYAINRTAADGFLTSLLAGLGLGQTMESSRDEDHDYTPDANVFTKLDFEECFEDRLTGVTGVLEMHVTESVTYSGTRWAVQDIPFDTAGNGGVSIPQPAGLAPGSRTVRGSVTAASLATAQAWARRQRALLTGDNNHGLYPQPEQMENDYEFVPRVDGIIGGTGDNVRLYRVNFQFSEILPLYPAPN